MTGVMLAVAIVAAVGVAGLALDGAAAGVSLGQAQDRLIGGAVIAAAVVVLLGRVGGCFPVSHGVAAWGGTIVLLAFGASVVAGAIGVSERFSAIALTGLPMAAVRAAPLVTFVFGYVCVLLAVLTAPVGAVALLSHGSFPRAVIAGAVIGFVYVTVLVAAPGLLLLPGKLGRRLTVLQVVGLLSVGAPFGCLGAVAGVLWALVCRGS